MARELSGKVELTWTNKQQRLITLESIPDGERYPYRWVSPSDYRVAETRLMAEVAHVGDDPTPGNFLVRGDALHALTALGTSSAGPVDLTEKVKLAYLDPPFNTGNTFAQYEDNLEKSIYLTMMRDRLKQVQKLLRPDGSIWLHCDDSMMAQLRIIMDEVFQPKNFLATVIWEKVDSPRMDAKGFSTRHDYIIVFAASEQTQLKGTTHDSGEAAHYNQVAADGRRYYLKPLRAMAGKDSTREARPTMWFSLVAPDGSEVWPLLPNGGDGRWRWQREKVEREGDRIEWVKGRKGWAPYFRIYGNPDAKRPPETMWLATEVGSNRTSKREIRQLFPTDAPFDTPKPEALMRRITEIATDPGDVVLDCFAGSATTAAVAHKLGRRWVTVELERESVERYCLPRLSKVVAGDDPGGITEAVDWQGGGGFSVLDVTPSMFDDYNGQVVLADWAVRGALGEAVAVQLGFSLEPAGAFCGRKGRTRLAVIDGLVNVAAADLILDQLADDEIVLLCGTGLDPEVADYLAKQRPGSSSQLIPQALLNSYGRPRRWSPLVGVKNAS